MEQQKKQRDLAMTPHLAQNNRNRRSAIDARTTRLVGYEISQRKRKRGERSVWMAEDDRIAAADALPKKRASGLDVYIRYSSLKSGVHPKPDGGSCVSRRARQKRT